MVTNREIIYTSDVVLKLRDFGLTRKLTSAQLDRNSIFCMSVPAIMAILSKEKLSDLSNQNPNLAIYQIYVMPRIYPTKINIV